MNKIKLIMFLIVMLIYANLIGANTLTLKYLYTTSILGEDRYLSIFLDSNENSYAFLISENTIQENSNVLKSFQTITLDMDKVSKEDNPLTKYRIEDIYYYRNNFDLKKVYKTNALYICNSVLYVIKDKPE